MSKISTDTVVQALLQTAGDGNETLAVAIPEGTVKGEDESQWAWAYYTQ